MSRKKQKAQRRKQLQSREKRRKLGSLQREVCEIDQLWEMSDLDEAVIRLIGTNLDKLIDVGPPASLQRGELAPAQRCGTASANAEVSGRTP